LGFTAGSAAASGAMAADGTSVPIPNTADNGYSSEEAVEKLSAMGFDPHIATGRQKHNQAAVAPATGAAPTEASVKGKMADKLRLAAGKALDQARKPIVEPVFCPIKSARGIRPFLLRGKATVSAEWQLICLTHNVLKIWRCSVRAAAR